NETASGIDRPAEENRRVRRVARHPDVQIFDQFVKPQSFDGFVDDQPHRAVGRMRTHKDDALFEARVGHARKRDKQLTLEEIDAFDGTIVLRHGWKISRAGATAMPFPALAAWVKSGSSFNHKENIR